MSLTLERPKTMPLEAEIAAYENMLGTLVEQYNGKFVVFRGGSFVSAHDTFEAAAEASVRKFGRGPYLIRQVGAQKMILPASVAYNFHNANC